MTPEERFGFAKGYRMDFGKHRGLTLNQIALIDILYLDKLRQMNSLIEPCSTALRNFVANEQVATDLEDAIAIRDIPFQAGQKGRY
jgi:hypothetical protein